MKPLLLSTVFFVGLAAAAAAADLPTRATPVAPSFAPAFTWNGFYAGANAGYMWSDSDTKLADVGGTLLPLDVQNGVFPRSISVERDSALGGVQAGYNAQFGMFVVGIEADIAFTREESVTEFSAVDPVPPPSPFSGVVVNSTYRSELEWLATLRMRAGAAFDRALVYGTFGLAGGEMTNSFSIGIPALSYSSTWARQETEWGWTIGAGVEYALTNNISVKAEYLYYDLGERTIHASDPANFGTNFIDYKFKNDGNIARAGVNFRF